MDDGLLLSTAKQSNELVDKQLGLVGQTQCTFTVSRQAQAVAVAVAVAVFLYVFAADYFVLF